MQKLLSLTTDIESDFRLHRKGSRCGRTSPTTVPNRDTRPTVPVAMLPIGHPFRRRFTSPDAMSLPTFTSGGRVPVSAGWVLEVGEGIRETDGCRHPSVTRGRTRVCCSWRHAAHRRRGSWLRSRSAGGTVGAKPGGCVRLGAVRSRLVRCVAGLSVFAVCVSFQTATSGRCSLRAVSPHDARRRRHRHHRTTDGCGGVGGSGRGVGKAAESSAAYMEAKGGGIAPVHSDTAAGRGGGEVGGRGGRGRVARGPRETEARGSGRGGGVARRRSASRRGMAGDQRQPPGRARGGGRPEARRAGEGRPAPSGDWAVGCAAQRERTYRVVYIQVHASSSTQRKDPQQNKKKKTSTAFPPRPRGQHEQDTRAREGRPPQRATRRTTPRRASARPCPLAAARAHRRARPRVGAGAAMRQPLATTTGAGRWPAAARGARQPPPSAAPPTA